jgi:hypothetical protein
MESHQRVIVEDIIESEIFAGKPSLSMMLHADVRLFSQCHC